MRSKFFGLAMLFVLACSENPVAGTPTFVSVQGQTDHSVTVPLGSELRITLGTVGPGEYSLAPSLSSQALQFEDVHAVNPVPAGIRQEFRFTALARGQVIVVFTHANGVYESVVTDTVTIQ